MNRSAPSLANFSSTEFLAKYWQTAPCLIKQALPGWRSPVTGDDLAGVALEPEAEARLVRYDQKRDQWSVDYNPFDEQFFARLPANNWTLLVQAMDLWRPEIASLKSLFHFLPTWRLEDVMVSFATPGGSVGPHFDQYDVFLLQGEGQRRWQLGDQCDADTPTIAEAPLSLLANFVPREEYMLDPGDILYVPPGWAHHGVALTAGQTFSIGFRAPTIGDLLADVAGELLSAPATAVYRDPAPEHWHHDLITEAHIDAVQSMLKTLTEDRTQLADWFARFVTRPRYEAGTTPLNERRTARLGDTVFLNGDKI